MRHLLSTSDLSGEDIVDILQLGESFAEVQAREIPKVPALRGKTVVLVFFEDSTRTRVSFDIAARRLSADVVNFSVSTSSTKKGESIRDTIETIDAMGVDALVVRHGSSGAPAQITDWTSAAVINAGDGWHAHPTQALLDCFTVSQHRKLSNPSDSSKGHFRFDGMKVAICGDINHSRVARSNVDAFTSLGAEVVLVGPGTMLPPSLEGWPVTVAPDFDSIIGEVDVAYMLRIQNERLGGVLLPSVREYRTIYGLTTDRAKKLKSDALIMHPGPMNRGVEIDPEVADDPRAVVTNQVANGVPIRMAVLFRALGPGQLYSDSSARGGALTSSLQSAETEPGSTKQTSQLQTIELEK